MNFSEKKINQLLSGKSYKDENFPVSSFLISNKYSKHIKNLYTFARTADDIADHKLISKSDKKKMLSRLDQILMKKEKTNYTFMNNLIETLIETGVTEDYPRKLLKAFIQDAEKKRYKNWKELIQYCHKSASPIGRFVVDLHGKKNYSKIDLKNIYDGCDKICNTLQILNHLQDCKEDFVKLDRIYIPELFFNGAKVNTNFFLENKNRSKFLQIKNKCIDEVNVLLAGASKKIVLIKDSGLRRETFVIFNIAKKLSYLLEKNDPIKKKVKLSRIDLIFCFFKGIIGRL